MHALEDDFPLSALHVQHAFVTIKFGAIYIDDGAEEIFQSRGIERTFCPENKALHIVFVCMVVGMIVAVETMFRMSMTGMVARLARCVLVITACVVLLCRFFS